MGACAKFAAACVVVALGLMPQRAATAIELVILTNQGATPGVKELAVAFARASGHKVTVIQEEGAARAMIRFMISPQAAPLLRKTHVEPARP